MKGLGGLLAAIGWISALLTGALWAGEAQYYSFRTPSLDIALDIILFGGGLVGSLVIAGLGHVLLGIGSLHDKIDRLAANAGEPVDAHDPATMPWSPKVDRARRTPPTVG